MNKKIDYDFTSDKAYRIKKYFETIGISPLWSYFPYIPSFGDVIEGKTDKNILNFAYLKTKHKNQMFG